MHGTLPVALRLCRRAAVALAMACATGPSMAAADAGLAAEPRLEEVVVTAAAVRTSPIEAAQPTAILSGDELRRQAAASLGETLSRQLGVSSTYFGPTASRPVIRGLGGYRVQVLDDGIASLDASSLSPDHAVTLEPVVAQQVEVIKGPAALLYGSGAAGGLVNVVSARIPSQRAALPVTGAVELRGETATGERTGALGLDLGRGALALHLDGFDRSTDDLRFPGGHVANSASDARGGAFGVSIIGERGFAGGALSRHELTYGIVGEPSAFIDLRQDRADVKAEWAPALPAIDAIRLRGAFGDYAHVEYEAPGEPATRFEQQGVELRLAVDHRVGEAWNGTLGVQVLGLDFSATGEEAFVPGSVTSAVSLFGFEQRRLGEWTLELGARAERQSIDPRSTAGLRDSRETAVSAAAGAVWHFAPGQALALHLTRTERNPQAVERYAGGPHVALQRFEVGHPALDKETALTADLSLRRSTAHLEWVVSAFYNDYDGYIFANPTGDVVDGLPVFAYAQADATFHGFEAELSIPLHEAGSRHLDLRLTSDYVRGRLRRGGDLPQIPPLRVGAGLHYDHGHWHAGLFAMRHARQDDVAAGERPTAGFTMLDVDVGMRLPTSRSELYFFLRGSNLLDEEARQHASALKHVAPLPGRSLRAGIRAAF